MKSSPKNTPPQTDEPAIKVLSFEDATRELEEIVQSLENGHVALGESLRLVQRGRELSDACAQMLDAAELTLSQLAATPEGELVEEELDWDGEE